MHISLLGVLERQSLLSWVVWSDDSGSAPIFVNTEQIDLFKDTNHVYFDASDATFKVMPYISSSQEFTIFVPCLSGPVRFDDSYDPCCFYRTVFQNDLVPGFTPQLAKIRFSIWRPSAILNLPYSGTALLSSTEEGEIKGSLKTARLR